MEKKIERDYILDLVVGEDAPDNVPNEFHIIRLYVLDLDNNLNLYAYISLPYLINHSEFINVIEDDPRYIFMEGYEQESKSCRYTCMIKPFGDMKGIYRILNGQLMKIREIDPLIDIDANIKSHTFVKNK